MFYKGSAVSSNGGGSGDAVWGAITGTLNNQTDLQTALNAKQNTLTAGSNISIVNGIISATDTTYSNFVGATSSVAGSTGLVPAPTTDDVDKYLKGDGTWEEIQSGIQNTTARANSIGIYGTVSTDNSISIGVNSEVQGLNSISLGYNSQVKVGCYNCIALGSNTSIDKAQSIAIGVGATTQAKNTIQLGPGINNDEMTFRVGFDTPQSGKQYELLDGTTGKIPNDRINGVSGSFTTNDGKTVTVTNGVITSIASISSNVNLTFTVTDEDRVESLIVNGTTYTSRDFSHDALTLQYSYGTSITWSITAEGVSPDPSQGNLTLTSDTTIEIYFGK